MDLRQGDWVKELRKGSIEVCLLSLLAERRMYGFELVKELRTRSNGYFDLKEGTLYPALHRLEKRGYLKSEWVIENNQKPRKYYALTNCGISELERMREEWVRMVGAVNRVLEVETDGG